MIRPFLRIQVQCKSVAGRRPSRWAIKRSDVITRLSVKGFQGCFANWTEAIRQATGGEVIAVDGKTVRGSRDRKRGRAALHMVSAWADTSRRVLGQEATAEKCNGRQATWDDDYRAKAILVRTLYALALGCDSLLQKICDLIIFAAQTADLDVSAIGRCHSCGRLFPS